MSSVWPVPNVSSDTAKEGKIKQRETQFLELSAALLGQYHGQEEVEALIRSMAITTPTLKHCRTRCYLLSSAPVSECAAGAAQPLLTLLPSPVRWMRAMTVAFDTFLRSVARPRRHMRSMKAVVMLTFQPNSLVE